MTENALMPLFEGREIRSLLSMGEPGWIPVIDLTRAWGLNRTTLFNHITRNREDFADCSRLVDILSTTGERETLLCVNEVGMYQLLTRVSLARIKSPAAKEAIRKFRKELPRFVQMFRKHEIAPVSQPQGIDVNAELQRAKMLAQETGGNLQAFQAIALEKCGLGDYAKALQPETFPALADAASQPGIWMTPTDIGRECGLSAREVNSWLYNHQYQYPEGPVWRLTTLGERFGEEYPFTSPYKHTETRIRWHRSVLVASGLKRPLSESQMALPSTARV